MRDDEDGIDVRVLVRWAWRWRWTWLVAASIGITAVLTVSVPMRPGPSWQATVMTAGADAADSKTTLAWFQAWAQAHDIATKPGAAKDDGTVGVTVDATTEEEAHQEIQDANTAVQAQRRAPLLDALARADVARQVAMAKARASDVAFDGIQATLDARYRVLAPVENMGQAQAVAYETALGRAKALAQADQDEYLACRTRVQALTVDLAKVDEATLVSVGWHRVEPRSIGWWVLVGGLMGVFVAAVVRWTVEAITEEADHGRD